MRHIRKEQQFQKASICIVIGKCVVNIYLFHWLLFPRLTQIGAIRKELIEIKPGEMHPRRVQRHYDLDWLCFEVKNVVRDKSITSVGIIYPAKYDYKKDSPELVDRRYNSLIQTEWFD